MAAPTFVAAGPSATATIAVTVNYPTGWADGDVLLLFVETCNQAVPSTPTGWTELASSPQGTGTGGTDPATRLTAFWKVAHTGDTASVSVGDSGDHQYGVIAAYRGVDTTGATPFDVAPVGGVDAASSTSGATGTSLTTVTNDCLVVIAFSEGLDSVTFSYSAWTNANLTSLTERFDDGGTTIGNGGGVGIADGVMTTAGAVGSTTVTYSTASVKGFMTIPLKAAAGIAAQPLKSLFVPTQAVMTAVW